MSIKIKLQVEERLTKDNFERWEFLINHIIKSKGILQYVNTDITSKFKKKLQKEKKDAMACFIICTTVSKEILDYINKLQYGMKKLKSIFGKKKFTEVNYWIKKLYSLKAKNLFEYKEIHPDGTEAVKAFLKEDMNKINYQIYLHNCFLEYISTVKNVRDTLTKDFNGSMMKRFTDQIFD
ncbi:hypothetical protein BCR32DRAFT_281036 [Anaeromyces robustus]|uniref:Uncharacterized protein n=1 Tax=Anaeromyces robustus TaxID=1754192 RepID=A0A1Y1X3F3_9FUNG|nr:hypothetical protein BCR32DRAFT_281036 [Anaeromyces robustus]|eukprot:ORX79844.1 hypothetical protein BCR32DRAFT_281036 [Anaeromyces robustus]